MPIKITIKPLRPTAKGVPYQVSVDGRVILQRSYVPSLDACRYLVAEGYSGVIEVWAEGEDHRPRMTITSIEKAAKLTVQENERHGPKVVRYEPYPRCLERVAR